MPLRLPTSIVRASTPRYTATTCRGFASTGRMGLKEDADRSAEQIESKKQESLDKQKKGEGHWHEELGSASESHITADRQDVKDHGDHISKLQQETKKKGEKGDL